MPFDRKVKSEMFIRSARLCCLCLKQCGTNMEAAHIIDENVGGSNDLDNGIPVCFDCHQEIGAYNPKHPKGNKFGEEELKARRDRVYRLVDSGALLAQISAERARQDKTTEFPTLTDIPEPPAQSSEATRFLDPILTSGLVPNALGGKFFLLRAQDRAQVLDGLLRVSNAHLQAISALGQIIQSPQYDRDEAMVVAEQAMRTVTLFGGVDAKAALLREFPEQLLAEIDDCLRLAFFNDLIGIVNADQFDEVNKIVPVLVNHAEIVPDDLRKDYVFALLDQARSWSYAGAPAARQALTRLPEGAAKAAIDALDDNYLYWHTMDESFRGFVARYKHLADARSQPMLTDFVELSSRDFGEKYGEC